MEEAKLQTLEQIKAFLEGTSEVAFRIPKEGRNQFIERVLKRFGYTHVVLDNHSAHISKETLAYLATRPGRFEYIHTPKHGSWLNLIDPERITKCLT